MAATAGMGIGQLLREGMAKLKADMGSAREKTEEGLLVCPTHDDVAVLAPMRDVGDLDAEGRRKSELQAWRGGEWHSGRWGSPGR